MGEIAKRPPRSPYTSEEIERGLSAVALTQGNTRRAAAALKQAGLPIPRTTLQEWVTNTHRDRYAVIANEELPHVYNRIAEGNEALAERLLKIEDQAAGKLEHALKADDLSPNEISTSLRNLSVSKGIAVDKASVIRGRPTEIREERSFAELARSIHERWGHVIKIDPRYFESTAVEVIEERSDARDPRRPLGQGGDHADAETPRE